MEDIEQFSKTLIEESIRFYEKALEEQNEDGKLAYLHASLLIGMSSLEAFINSIADELLTRDDLPLAEKALLAERDIKLVDGQFELTSQLKISRTVDRIQYLYRKFALVPINTSDLWWMDLKQGLDMRNSLVHPKGTLSLKSNQVERTLNAIIETINQLCFKIYKKGFPLATRGLISRLDF